MNHYDTTIERLWTIREERRILAKEDAALKAEYDELKTNLISNMQADGNGVKSISTTLARVTLTQSIVARAVDKDAFADYVREHDAFHLLTYSPKSASCVEAITALGETIPGIELITLTDLSVTTVKA